MNRDILKSSIADIKASDEFKKRVTGLMIEKNNSKTKGNKSYKGLIVAASLFLIFSIIAFSTKYTLNTHKKSGGSFIPRGISSMFIYDGSLYYIDYKNILYQLDNSSGKGIKKSKIDIAEGSRAFEYKGHIYYSNGLAIYEKSLKEGTFKKLVTGENLGVSDVGDGRLYYSISYKDKKGGFSEFEYHIYDLSTGKDTILFNRSHNMWSIWDAEENIVIADAYMPVVEDDIVVAEVDSGIFSIASDTGTFKKISDMRTLAGCLEGENFYHINSNSSQLYSTSLSKNESKQIQFPNIKNQGYIVDSVTVYGGILYAGVYFADGSYHDEQSYVIGMDLKTGETSILANASNRIYKLCTDGKTLYAYDTGYPHNTTGNITVINLK